MGRHCIVYNCRGNYRGEPYSQVVKFPTDENERSKWISALPNDPKTSLKRKELWICVKRFDCAWKTTRGGKRPAEPPSIFEGVPKSCMKQIKTTPRLTTAATSERRRKLQEELNERLDQINDFKCFVDNVADYAESFRFVKSCQCF